jgi:hypothetical protein
MEEAPRRPPAAGLRRRVRRRVRHAGLALPVGRAAYRAGKEIVRPRLHALPLDIANRVTFGPGAPRFAERLYIDPRQVVWCDRHGDPFTSSARVVDGAWPPPDAAPLQSDAVLQAAIRRWHDGLPWEETGEIERMMRAIARNGPLKGCSDRRDILRRCEQLDRVFQTVESERRLQPHGAQNPATFREFGGIGMHLGPGGVLVRGGNGRHRFAMAWILGLPSIPVRVGFVHRQAVPLLTGLRRDAAGRDGQPGPPLASSSRPWGRRSG